MPLYFTERPFGREQTALDGKCSGARANKLAYMKKLVAPLAISALLVTGLAGCSVDFGALLTGGGQTTAEQPGGDSGSEAQPLDPQDIMFLQMMIVHHGQAIELADLALANTSTPEIIDLATRIKAAQEPEIATMTSWLENAGASVEGHVMEMDGMVEPETMAELASLTDSAFDALFLMSMIQHHQGAIDMSSDIASMTSNDDLAAFADTIRESQSAEIDEMNLLLGP